MSKVNELRLQSPRQKTLLLVTGMNAAPKPLNTPHVIVLLTGLRRDDYLNKVVPASRHLSCRVWLVTPNPKERLQEAPLLASGRKSRML